MTDSAPIIVSALFGDTDQSWLDHLRRTHFPPERNRLPAHLTIFHHLPPSVTNELRDRITGLTRDISPPRAAVGGVLNLGRGVAYRIDSPDLEILRADLADAFANCLTPQDRAAWRPHVTIQNKVTPDAAAALHHTLSADFRRRPLVIAGLGVWRYRGGPWEPLSRHMFSRSGRSRRS